jgi:hypothetical protein
METFTVEVEHVTFMLEAEDQEAAVQQVYEILWDVAHDYTAPVVL